MKRRKMVRLKRPKSTFEEWLRDRERDEFLRDVNSLCVLVYYASLEESELDPDVRMELTKKLLVKLDQRRGYTNKREVTYDPRFWDGRNWRGVEPLRKRLEASFGSFNRKE